MIKVEVLKDGNFRQLFFESNKPEDRDTLDEILQALVGPFPRRGGYVTGASTDVLRVEVNLGN